MGVYLALAHSLDYLSSSSLSGSGHLHSRIEVREKHECVLDVLLVRSQLTREPCSICRHLYNIFAVRFPRTKQVLRGMPPTILSLYKYTR